MRTTSRLLRTVLVAAGLMAVSATAAQAMAMGPANVTDRDPLGFTAAHHQLPVVSAFAQRPGGAPQVRPPVELRGRSADGGCRGFSEQPDRTAGHRPADGGGRGFSDQPDGTAGHRPARLRAVRGQQLRLDSRRTRRLRGVPAADPGGRRRDHRPTSADGAAVGAGPAPGGGPRDPHRYGGAPCRLPPAGDATDHTTTADHGRDVNNPRAAVLLRACGPHLGVTVSRALRNESDVPFRDQRADISMP